MPNSAGTYHGKLENAYVDKNANDKPLIILAFGVLWIMQNGAWVACTCTANIRLYLTDAAWEYSERTLKDLGFNGDFPNLSIACFSQDIVETGIELYNQPSDGYDDWGISFSSGPKKGWDNSDLALFTAKWKGQNPQAVAAPGAPPVAVPATSTPAAAVAATTPAATAPAQPATTPPPPPGNPPPGSPTVPAAPTQQSLATEEPLNDDIPF